MRCRDKHGRFERFGHRFFLTDNANACPSRGFMNPSLAAVSAFGLRAPETFETAISAGARHMASERLARDMQGYLLPHATPTAMTLESEPERIAKARSGSIELQKLPRTARRWP